MIDTRPAIDVVMPCHNYGRFLERAVRAALDQPGVNVRLLIVDDCSTDDSADRASELAAQHENVELHRNHRNLGPVPTFNVGIEWVTAPAFALISSDDLLAPGSLGRACAVLADHSEVGMVHGDLVTFDGDDAPVLRADDRRVSLRIFTGREWIQRRCAAGENNIFSPEIVVRTDVQRQVGPYRPDLPHTHDLYNWLCVAAFADVARLRGTPAAYYRRHPHNHSARHTSGRLAVDLRERHAAFRLFFERSLLEPGTIATLRRQADRAIADRAIDAANRTLNHGGSVESADDLRQLATDLGPSRRPAILGFWLRRRCRRSPWLMSILLAPGRVYVRLRGRRAYRRWLRDPE